MPQEQSRLDLSCEAGQQRGQHEHQEHLTPLLGQLEDHGHIANPSSRTTNATKTMLRKADGEKLGPVERAK